MRGFSRASFARLAATAVAVVLAGGAGCAAHRRAPVVRSPCTRPAPALTAARIRDAYQAPALSARGLTGAGTVIAVIIPGTAPGIAADIAAYSRAAGLPVPPVRVLSYGDVRAVSTADGAAWVQEGVLDLEMAHTLAPGAGLADISMDGSPCSPVRVYTGTVPPPRQHPGWVTGRGGQENRRPPAGASR